MKRNAKAPLAQDDWPLVVDAHALSCLESDSEVHYLVIPVAKSTDSNASVTAGSQIVKEKVNALLSSLGLKTAFTQSNLGHAESIQDREKEFDLFEGFADERVANSKKQEQLRQYILQDAQWLDAEQLSSRAGFENKNRSAGPANWKSRNKIFAISLKGKNYYPAYCLDEAAQLLPVVKEILDIFDGVKSGWSLAFWFGTSNSWLGGAKPKEVLNGSKEALLRAARAAKDGIEHG